jgi:hypothetical protein
MGRSKDLRKKIEGHRRMVVEHRERLKENYVPKIPTVV